MVPFSPKQLRFLKNCTATWNIAHGAVRTGKTIITLYAFMCAVDRCEDSRIWMIGYTASTIYDNAIRLLFEDPVFSVFRPFCTWNKQSRVLTYKDKVINTCGADTVSSAGRIQGQTISLIYCDEMTLFSEGMIYMIDTRLSKDSSKGFAAMNPSHPDHTIKQWIDKGINGDDKYYSEHFLLDDNPFVSEDYKSRIRNSLSGIFYKRNYLGEWCLAEGAIFEFFDEAMHVIKRPPRAAEYWIAGIDYGTSNAFCCLLIGVSTGRYEQKGRKMWVEKEYYWDSKAKGRQKLNSEYADDVQAFLQDYAVKAIYVDPSAAAFKAEMRSRKMHCVDANNDVINGIHVMTDEMLRGNLVVCSECTNLIREIKGYVWDISKSKKGEDAPLKVADHCFCAGTLIYTGSGEFGIEDIKVGDLVYTRNGLKPVIRVGNNIKSTSLYHLYNKKIRCTSDHLFYTDRGWIEISNLLQSDILYTIGDECLLKKNVNLWTSTGKGIDAIQDLKICLKECTSKITADICIERFINIIEDQSLKDVIFITKMGTPLTMIYPILSVLPHQNMLKDILNIIDLSNSLLNAEEQLQNGINLKKEENGIENMPKRKDLENGSQKNLNAKSVGDATQALKDQEVDFVRIIVNLDGDEDLELIMSKDLVLNVLKLSQQIGIQKQNAVLARVVPSSQSDQVVYNLEVEGCHEFFAEGFLVHNSIDALRYSIATHKVPSYTQSETNIFSPEQKIYTPREFGFR